MIKKRDGHVEPLSVEKTKRMIAFACLGLDSCDPMELELDSKLQFVDGMTTQEIQKTLIQTAIEKVIQKKDDGFGNQVNKMNQDWQFVAARLFLFDLYKEAAITRRYKAFGYGNFPNLVNMLVEEKNTLISSLPNIHLMNCKNWAITSNLNAITSSTMKV